MAAPTLRRASSTDRDRVIAVELVVVALVVGTAAGLEALQLLTPDRHGRAADAFVKALGGISGISVGQTLSFLLRINLARSDGSTRF